MERRDSGRDWPLLAGKRPCRGQSQESGS